MYSQSDAHSWDQDHPRVSLELLDACRVGSGCSVIDVGGGDSQLVDALLGRGHACIAVLDVAAGALAAARHRLGPRADSVTWLVEDLLTWEPRAAWDVWHDRAVFHFLTNPADRARYLEELKQATRPASTALIGTLAADGPSSCSGLPAARYDVNGLAAEFGDSFEVVTSVREIHTTPAGSPQPITWLGLRRR